MGQNLDLPNKKVIFFYIGTWQQISGPQEAMILCLTQNWDWGDHIAGF